MKTRIIILLMLVAQLSATAQLLPPDKGLQKLKWRPVGPANMGGRVTDIAGVPGDPTTFYVGGADGGIFKTSNGGVTFEPIFDGQRAYSIGTIAVAPSDPEVLWVGTGEGDPRNSVGYGYGVYRSTDGGKTWSHLGLEKTDRIKRIAVHPTNPDEACVCAMGREWGPNADRGVFRTVDGGKTWEKVLYLDENTGCSDIAIEWNNPRILYAGMWTFRRKPWRFDDGGDKTALYKSTNGGKTWTKISHKNGLPDKPMARIGVSIAQHSPNIVYLITEFVNDGTLFRSEDRGETWSVVNKDRNLNFRPFYYSDVKADPNNSDHVYTLSGGMSKSTDGGRTFMSIARGQHGDNQALWIDPKNSNRVLSGDDGGFRISYDGFKTFDAINNVELSQFYQLWVDDRDPYYLYGGLQDNGTWTGPSNSLHQVGIIKRDWIQVAGGDGYYAVPISGKENEVYANLQGGVIFHVDTKTGNTRTIHPYPNKIGSAGDGLEFHKYRFNWDAPIHISPHDPNTVYTGGNVLFRSKDKGYTWDEISPDLTTNDKSKQKSSGGEIYQDNTAAEFHCTILTIAESPVKKDVIWCGTDDGNVQLTQDGGKTWTKMNIPGFPSFGWVSKIHASEHEAGTAFVAVDNHRLDDYKAHAYMTTDFGKTWLTISGGLPEDWVYVVRQDPSNASLLYAGMEHGVFASWDKGKSWTKINNNLPPVSVRDLRVQKRERDLVVATHGRGIWILDDATGLQNYPSASGKALTAFPTKTATLWKYYSMIEEQGDRAYAARNPDFGANLNFYLQADPKQAVTVDIFDGNGAKVRSLRDTLSKAGLNRIVWDLRYDEATRAPGAQAGGRRRFGGGGRPLVAPGSYTAKISANGQTAETTFTVRGDPRIQMTDADYKLKTETALALRDQLSQVNKLISTCDQTIKQLQELKQRIQSTGENGGVDPSVNGQIDDAVKSISEFEDDVLRRPPPNMGYRQRPRLREEVSSLFNAVDDPSARPTTPQLNRRSELDQEGQQAASQLEKILQEKVGPVNEKTKSLPQVVVGKTDKKDM